MNSFEPLISYCAELLNNFDEAKDVSNYLHDRLSKSAQTNFGFGWFPNNHNLQLLSSVMSDEVLNKLHLIYDRAHHNGYELIKHRHSNLEQHNLIMPYRDVYGNIVGIVGRTIQNDDEREISGLPKYINTRFEKRHHLFGLYNAKRDIVKKNCCYIVEGQFDCISAHDKGMSNVVALGSSGMSFEQCALLLRYTNNFILLLDNDEAGDIGSKRIIEHYSKYASIRIAKLPLGYKDLYDALRDISTENLELALK